MIRYLDPLIGGISLGHVHFKSRTTILSIQVQSLNLAMELITVTQAWETKGTLPIHIHLQLYVFPIKIYNYIVVRTCARQHMLLLTLAPT
jgi:hypothetical protein